jgi:hypothetical protein
MLFVKGLDALEYARGIKIGKSGGIRYCIVGVDMQIA